MSFCVHRHVCACTNVFERVCRIVWAWCDAHTVNYKYWRMESVCHDFKRQCITKGIICHYAALCVLINGGEYCLDVPCRLVEQTSGQMRTWMWWNTTALLQCEESGWAANKHWISPTTPSTTEPTLSPKNYIYSMRIWDVFCPLENWYFPLHELQWLQGTYQQYVPLKCMIVLWL